jgi:nitric oxide reductase NorQ protein
VRRREPLGRGREPASAAGQDDPPVTGRRLRAMPKAKDGAMTRLQSAMSGSRTGTAVRLRPGLVFETTFTANGKRESAFRYRATHVNGRRGPKVVLSNDDRIRPGQACRVRVTRVEKPAARGRGHIEVEFAGPALLSADDPTYFIDRTAAMTLQAMIESGFNVLLDGPQGCGKTLLSRVIADALGMEYVFFNCSACYEATDFMASLTVSATESGHVETVWIPTDILRALEAARGSSRRYLIFLDEFNRCREMARNGIMPALDSTRRLYNPATGSTVFIPENVLWVAAINNGAEFTGTTNVDPAQLDRFSVLKLDYPPAAEEIRVLRHRHAHVPPGAIARVVHLANCIRRSRTLRVGLSMRATDEVVTLLEHPNFADGFDGDPVAELVKHSFCGRFPGRWDDPSTEAGLVWKAIAAELGSPPDAGAVP